MAGPPFPIGQEWLSQPWPDFRIIASAQLVNTRIHEFLYVPSFSKEYDYDNFGIKKQGYRYLIDTYRNMTHIINADHVLFSNQYSVTDTSSEHRVGTSISYAGFIIEHPHFCLK